MPCRALEAFRPRLTRRCRFPGPGLNALSGIGGVQTHHIKDPAALRKSVLMPCRALEAFRLKDLVGGAERLAGGLNALSGIGGVQTTASVPSPGRATGTS